MNQHRDVRSNLQRRSIHRMVKVTSISPSLYEEGRRVLHLPIDSTKASVQECVTRLYLGSPRQSYREIDATVPGPPVIGADIAREPAVLEQAITRRVCVTSPPNWKIAPGSFASLSGPGSPAHRGAVSGPESPDGRCPSFQVAVHDATFRIARLAHRRKGLPPSRIGQMEIDSHLNEARAAKGVPRENARLVAVFRKIPVELISRMRFDEIRRLLLFRLVSCEGLSSTRVYDMAAVRDLLTRKLHLIPNRARYREVSLS